ncbi:hypothetical protein [Adhaeribacter rhizoryzae]|uniref:Uncharacterized protein n=1 Tax=Adhaeribacter rhizoryzae TaxID=2607907 RepID=A0A5M6D8V7_9BACT|nr:hypothetical protein [Adhaeribacter rhizoryzae]KAA5543968.1 hypothetical protein F0145_15420 [Adhaeribacter rhizoryzae]
MKWPHYLPLLFILMLFGCGIREREELVQKREAALARKEQELLVMENNLQLKEAELMKREQQLKTAQKPDTLAQPIAGDINLALVGAWSARMVCTETTCSGSAVGDTKTETWELSYQNNLVIAKAMTGENLARIYTGTYHNNLLELTENVELTAASPATKMVVRLTLLNPTTLVGQREIIRAGDCRIVYDLQLNKQ